MFVLGGMTLGLFMPHNAPTGAARPTPPSRQAQASEPDVRTAPPAKAEPDSGHESLFGQSGFIFLFA